MVKFSKILLIGGAFVFLLTATATNSEASPPVSIEQLVPKFPDMVVTVGVEYPYIFDENVSIQGAPVVVGQVNTRALRNYDPGKVFRV